MTGGKGFLDKLFDANKGIVDAIKKSFGNVNHPQEMGQNIGVLNDNIFKGCIDGIELIKRTIKENYEADILEEEACFYCLIFASVFIKKARFKTVPKCNNHVYSPGLETMMPMFLFMTLKNVSENANNPTTVIGRKYFGENGLKKLWDDFEIFENLFSDCRKLYHEYPNPVEESFDYSFAVDVCKIIGNNSDEVKGLIMKIIRQIDDYTKESTDKCIYHYTKIM